MLAKPMRKMAGGILLFALCCGTPMGQAWGQALSAAFTYQGQLTQTGSPVDGAVGMRFVLYDSANGSNSLGVVILNPVPVENGLFTVELDFGFDVFNGQERWLEVIVDGQTLTPRQRLAAAPYSLQTRGIFVNGSGNVGIGTAAPQGKLHVVAPSGDDSVILPDDSIGSDEILGEPGQSRSEVPGMITLANGSETTIVYAGIYCPTDGFVLAMAETEFINGAGVGGIPEIRFDVRPLGSTANAQRIFRIGATVGHRVGQSCIRVFPVQEGQQSFEFFGQSLDSAAAGGRCFNSELTLVFLPMQY